MSALARLFSLIFFFSLACLIMSISEHIQGSVSFDVRIKILLAVAYTSGFVASACWIANWAGL